MTLATVAQQIRRVQLDLAWTVERLNAYQAAITDEIAHIIERIETAHSWNDGPGDALLFDEARDSLRLHRLPLDAAIRDAGSVLHLLDDLDRDLLTTAC